MVGSKATNCERPEKLQSRFYSPRRAAARDRVLGASALGRKVWLIGLVLVFAAPFTGCSTLQTWQDYVEYCHPVNEFTTGVRGRLAAREAWRAHEAEFADLAHRDDFADGFRVGYTDVARGELGCPPPVPPRRYWRRRYESPEGREQVAAWYAGYDNGAVVAETDGVGAWRPIPPSPRLGLHPLETHPAPRALSEFPASEFLSGEESGESLESPPGAAELPLTAPERRPPPADRQPPGERLPTPVPPQRFETEEPESP